MLRSVLERTHSRVLESERRASAASSAASHASAFLAAAVENIPDPMHAVNARLQLSAYNAAFERFVRDTFDRPVELGVSIEDFYPARDRPAWSARYARALGGEDVTFDHAAERRDGSISIAEVRLSPIRREGAIVGVVVTSRDSTQERRLTARLRESEEHFRSLIEHSTDVITLIGRDGGIRYASPSMTATLGWEPGEATGRSLMMLTHPDDVESVRDAVRKVEHDPLLPGRLQFRLRHKDGGWRTLEATFSAQVLPSGETTFVVNARDVSEREALEQELRQRQRGASLGRLVSGVAHEFNNLLTTILGNAELARATGDSAELQAIDLAARRGRDLVKHLQRFSGASGGEPEVFVPSRRIADVHDMLARVLGEDITVETHLSEHEWAVRMAPRQFEQLLVNLALAGRAVMPRGGTLTIETDVARVTQQFLGRHPYVRIGEYVVLNVVDQGEPTLDDQETYSPAAEDARASLAICDELVQRAGGYLWTYREPGFGTCYRTFLPRHADSAEAPAGAPGEPEQAPVGTETVLLAEDDPAIRSLTARALRQHGYHVLEAANGRDAIALARSHVGPLHVVLSDLVMPQMNGDELLEQVRARHPNARLMLMSGYTAGVARPGRLRNLGVAFLDKPFTSLTLLQRVRAVLDAPA
jgi:PAS domain S-box-containing protein